MNPITEAWENREEGDVYVTGEGWDAPRPIEHLQTVVIDGDTLDKGETYARLRDSTIRWDIKLLTLVTEPEAAPALFDFIVADSCPVSWEEIIRGHDSGDIELELATHEDRSVVLDKALEWLVLIGSVESQEVGELDERVVTYRAKVAADAECEACGESTPIAPPEDATLCPPCSDAADELVSDVNALGDGRGTAVEHGGDPFEPSVCELCNQGPEDGEDLDECEGCSRFLCTRDACQSTAEAGQEGNFCRLCQAADAAQEILDAVGIDQNQPSGDVYVIGADFADDPRPISAISPSACPSCGDEEGFQLASHGCECGRMVCTDCNVNDEGEPAPCSGRCKICRGGEPANLRADQYVARIGYVDYPLGSLRLVTDPAAMAAEEAGEVIQRTVTPTGNRKAQARAAKRRVVWKPSSEVWAAICWKADELSEEGKPVAPHDLARQIAEDAAGAVVIEHQEALQRGALDDVPTQMLLEVAADREPALAEALPTILSVLEGKDI